MAWDVQQVRLPFKTGLWRHLDRPSADQMVESLTEYPVRGKVSMKIKFYQRSHVYPRTHGLRDKRDLRGL